MLQWRNVGGSNDNGIRQQESGFNQINQGFKNALDYNIQKQKVQQNLYDQDREANTSIMASRIANAKTNDEMNSIIEEAKSSGGSYDINALTQAQKVQGKDIYSKKRDELIDTRYDEQVALKASNRAEDMLIDYDKTVEDARRYGKDFKQKSKIDEAKLANERARIAAMRKQAKVDEGDMPKEYFDKRTGKTIMLTDNQIKAKESRYAYDDTITDAVKNLNGVTVGGKTYTPEVLQKMMSVVDVDGKRTGLEKVVNLSKQVNASVERKWNNVDERVKVVKAVESKIPLSDRLNQTEKNRFIEDVGKKLQATGTPMTTENIARIAEHIYKQQDDDIFRGGKNDAWFGAADSQFENLMQSFENDADFKVAYEKVFDKKFEGLDKKTYKSKRQDQEDNIKAWSAIN